MHQGNKLPAAPNYKGLSKNQDDLLVQKSNPLQTLSQTSLTLAEFKILDAYLSRIDSHKPDARFVQFERGELEQLLGVDKIPLQELEKRLRNLFQVIRVEDEEKKKGYKLIGLFEESDFDMDENGLWQVNLCCTKSAMEYIFNIDNLGYLRYRLKNVVGLTSRYSYILYLYLENNRFRKSWAIPVDELKTVLSCAGESYSQFKVFNDRILKRSWSELNEKTDIKFSYEAVRKGRRVQAIRFTLQTVKDQLEEITSEQLSFLGMEKDDEIKYSSEKMELLSEVCDNEFTETELRVLFDLILRVIPYDARGGLDHVDYLCQKYNLMRLYADRKKISDRFSYLKTSIERDIID